MRHQRFRRSDHTTEQLSSTVSSLKETVEDERFRAIFEQAAVGMAYMDVDGYLQQTNSCFCEILGYECDELLQRGFLDITHPDDVQVDLDYLRSTVSTAATKPHVRETRYLRKNGSFVWVNLTMSPVYLSNGLLDCFVCTIEDISQRKQLEEQLLLSEQQATSRFRQLEAIFETITDGLIVYDAQGRIVRINPASRSLLAVKGRPENYVEQPVPGRASLFTILDENGHPLPLEQTPVMRILRGEELTGGRAVDVRLKEDGYEEIQLNVSGAPLRDQEGHILGAVCVFRDVTERRRMEKELESLLFMLQQTNARLEQVNKVQSDFIAIVSHEFRTTLTGIQGFSELLRDEDFDVAEVKEYANDINTDALRLNRMISELLDLERMKSGKMSLHLSKFDVNTVLQEVAERMILIAPNHTLRLDIDESLSPFEGDYDKVMQLVTNLVSNAVKYSPAHSEIFLKSRQEGNNIHIIVQDQGIGIPEDAQKAIFVPYSRIHSAKTRYIQGVGLGLAIVQQIVQMHEGHIWVESKLGHGSTFHVILPMKGLY
ncbi:MAG: PAS domain S-box protein [Ktedonobacteraceae bacterium]|nr:PAS domain S-box protein [Ktedonobacteraceae bacterium]MBV9712911.1 PAS domain S-box protein [Ktedonobacteraceae bacterium]